MPRRGSSFDERDAQELAQTFSKLPRSAQITLIILAVAAGIIFWIAQHHRATGPVDKLAVGDVSDSVAENLFLGNPSDAANSFLKRDNYLVDKTYYALSYNDSTGDANWVSWRLTVADLGSAPRKAEFDPDETLPATFKRVVSHDYVGSGFDRGHLCPHGDREGSIVESDSTFCMTNILPQSHLINEGLWGDEEDYLRRLVRSGHRLYIIAGPIGQGGRGAAGERTTIAAGKVIVPASMWKVAVVIDESGGTDSLSQITTKTRVVSVIIPNDSGQASGSWSRFRVKPADIERATHLHFFTALAPDVRSALDEQLDQSSVY